MEKPITYTGHEYGVSLGADTLQLDISVQRAIVPARLAKLARNFNPDLLGELLVSRRPDGDYIIDGQHRQRAALMQNPDGLAPGLTCEVFTGLSRRDEARLFLGRNDKSNVSWLDKDRNMATMGDQSTLNIQMAAQAAGYVFIAEKAGESTFRDRAAAESIMADAERRPWVDCSGPAHLQRVLKFYATIYGTAERPSGIVLRALSKIFASRKIKELDGERLRDLLARYPADHISYAARQHKEELAHVRGMSPVTATVEIVAIWYNRGLPEKDKRRIPQKV